MLKKNSRLQRIDDLTIELYGNRSLLLKWGDNEYFYADMDAFAILHLFQKPLSFADALSELEVDGAADFAAQTEIIDALFAAGVLVDCDVSQETGQKKTGGFGGANIHIAMLNDLKRTNSYLKGIADVVQAGDIVVDIGTGTGVLAMAAVRAGAAHVYAIEENDIVAQVAQRNFEKNGVADKITLCHGRSTHIDLPVEADVLVSEIIGNNPFDENIQAITADAVMRFLKPGGRLVPHRLTVWGLPLIVPRERWEQSVVADNTLAKWQTDYGFDFSGLQSFDVMGKRALFSIKPQDTKDWETMAEPICLVDLDLTAPFSMIEGAVEAMTAVKDGDLNGVLVFFEAHLGSQLLSTNPILAGERNHWDSPVWPVSPPSHSKKGILFLSRIQLKMKSSACVLLAMRGSFW